MHLPLIARNINNLKENSLRIVKKVLGHNILKLILCRTMLLSIMHKSCDLQQSNTFLLFSGKIAQVSSRGGNIKNKFYRHAHIYSSDQTEIHSPLSYNTIDYKIDWQLANQMLLLPTHTEFLRHKTVALSGVTFLVLKLKLFCHCRNITEIYIISSTIYCV